MAAYNPLPQLRMGLGNKNRQKLVAELCQQHLRTAHQEKLALVEEYIAEIESAGDTPACWTRFCDLKRDNREMLERLDADFNAWLNP